MEFAEYWERARLIEWHEDETEKKKMRIAAFIGWQSGAGGKKSLAEYWRHLGLVDGPGEMTPEQRRRVVSAAIGKAERIREMDRRSHA